VRVQCASALFVTSASDSITLLLAAANHYGLQRNFPDTISNSNSESEQIDETSPPNPAWNSLIITSMPDSRSLKKARVLSSRESYRGPLFWVTTDEVLEPSGIRVRRDVVNHPGSVVILAVEESSGSPRILIEKQYRHAAGRFLYELPAGRIDKGENELKAAKRELLEETGYSARSWKRILRFWASPGFVAEAMSLYLARDLRPGAAQPEDDEVIDLQLVPLEKAVSMVFKGTIQDAKTIAGVLWLDRQRRDVSRKNVSPKKKL
jgi:ADP-ribose pyrophosphatase